VIERHGLAAELGGEAPGAQGLCSFAVDERSRGRNDAFATQARTTCSPSFSHD